MHMNIADSERIVRLVSGIIITSLAFWGPMNNWFLLGLIPVMTAILGVCPLYKILSYSSRIRN